MIIVIAALLRLLFINTTQFMADHAMFYQMASDGLTHHLWPISGNRASTGPLIPPLFVYLMMLPASISPNPIGGAIFIALCNVAGVLFTYLFTCRYYGRLAGAIAASLYATAINVIIFNRDIWQPDLLPPLVILYIWCLFKGAVEQRRHWFFPAVLLLGAMCQLHTTAIYLAVPLCIAFILAFKTIRIGEVALTGGAFLVLFAPYILLEFLNKFGDIGAFAQLARLPASLNTQALQFYGLFIRSTVYKPWEVNAVQMGDTHLFLADDHSIMLTTPLRSLWLFLQIENVLMPYLFICAVLASIFMLLRPGKQADSHRGMAGLWQDFLSSPERKGLLLLLAWQSIVVLMLRTPINLFIHYLLFLVPGQLILLAIFLSVLPALIGHFKVSWEKWARYGIVVLSALIVFAQLIGSIGTLIDRAQGNFNSLSVSPEYFDLASLQTILGTADQLAQEHHIARIYMPTDRATTLAIQYLAQFERTPIVTFDDDQCMILPSAEAGPVVFIVPPNSPETETLLPRGPENPTRSPTSPEIETILHRYANAALLDTVAHPGGAPFQLDILTAKLEPAPTLQLTGGWQSLSAKAQVLSSLTTSDAWLVTRWRIPTLQRPAPRTTYNYQLAVRAHGANANLDCSLTAAYAGDQLFALQSINKSAPLPKRVSIQADTFTLGPATYPVGWFTFVTFDEMSGPVLPVQPANGEKQVVLDISPS